MNNDAMPFYGDDGAGGRGDRRTLLTLACLAVACLLIGGFFYAVHLFDTGLMSRKMGWGNAFYFLYAMNEPSVALLYVFAMLGCIVWFGLRRPFPALENRLEAAVRGVTPLRAALAVFVVTALGNIWVYASFPLCMDEFVPVFQTKVFSQGMMEYPLPEVLKPVAVAATPIFIVFNPETVAWHTAYLPLHAVMATPFYGFFDLAFLFNSLLAAGSVLLVGALCTRLYPGDDFGRGVAVLLFATSSQLLITSMSFYSMPSVLFLNLLWLWLFLGTGRQRLWCLPLGLFALGVHNPMPHLLFAFVSCFLLLLRKQWRTAALFVAAYALFLLFWYKMMVIFDYLPGMRAKTPVAFDFIHQSLLQVAYFTEIVTWNNLALALLVVLGLRYALEMPRVQQLLLLNFAAFVGFYFFFDRTQGHGWGYRYIYPALANLALVVPWVWKRLAQEGLARPLVVPVAAGSLLSLLVVLPLRSVQVNSFIMPFKDSWEYVASRDADFVLIDHTSNWYSQDLVRNFPVENPSPAVLHRWRLDDATLQRMQEHFTVETIDAAKLADFGLPEYK